MYRYSTFVGDIKGSQFLQSQLTLTGPDSRRSSGGHWRHQLALRADAVPLTDPTHLVVIEGEGSVHCMERGEEGTMGRKWKIGEGVIHEG